MDRYPVFIIKKETVMSEKIVLFGYGAVGQAVVQQLSDAGRPVTVAQRSRPAVLPPLASYSACDVKDLAASKAAVAGANAVICAIGLTYDGAIWSRDWPVVMSNLLDACAASGARLVFVDNLYMYGPQTRPLTEDMPLTTHGIKPRVRAEITQLWQAAHAAGKVKVVAVRASDFYGPGVTQSVLGETGLAAMVKGKPALLLGSADLQHDLAYVPDVARATITLLDAPMDAYGQAWHVPCAPTRTYRQILQIGADTLGQTLKVSVLPAFMLGILGFFMPILREMKEMRFQSDRPYLVDASRFAKRFWSDATPFEIGIARAIQSFDSPNLRLFDQQLAYTMPNDQK